MRRRRFLALMGVGSIGVATAWFWPDEGMRNPCLPQATPVSLLHHDLVQSAWEGIDITQLWDCHIHVIGTGDQGSGIWLNPNMQNPLSVPQFLRYHFYRNAACVDPQQNVDVGYVQRLLRLYQDFPHGARMMLLAFDFHYDRKGRRVERLTPFYVPNDYAASVAKQNPDRCMWIASIHPYREDCVEALALAVAQGARAIKWLPPVMGMDPSSPLCDRFYAALVRFNIPLLSHAGDEHAVGGVDAQALGNPLLLRRALDHGVRVIVAHCASVGSNIDIDKGRNGSRAENFALFTRLMEVPEYEGRLFGEISAMTQLNRVGLPLETVITRQEWHARLINGSDYPLPGVMPLFSSQYMAQQGYLSQTQAKVLAELRRYNPLLYDFVLKRTLRFKGQGFAPQVFESRRIFDAV